LLSSPEAESKGNNEVVEHDDISESHGVSNEELFASEVAVEHGKFGSESLNVGVPSTQVVSPSESRSSNSHEGVGKATSGVSAPLVNSSSLKSVSSEHGRGSFAQEVSGNSDTLKEDGAIFTLEHGEFSMSLLFHESGVFVKLVFLGDNDHFVTNIGSISRHLSGV